MDVATVEKLEAKSHDRPEETRTPAKARVDVNKLGDVSIARFTFEPGWEWAQSVKPVAGTEHCEANHLGYAISGAIEVWTTRGDRITIRGGESYAIPPGHDARVVGNEPFVAIEFASAATYAKR